MNFEFKIKGKNYSEFLTDLFFPKFCLGCQKEGTFLCNDCRELLEIGEFDYCLCNKPLRILPGQKNGKCQACQAKKLSGIYFALSYKNILAKRLIRQFKYEPYLKDLKSTLAGILIEHFVKTKKNTDEIWENSILIPAPIDSKKLKIRGYNQSEELAEELSKTLKVPVVSDILIKIKKTAPQMELSKQERENNLIGAFSINNRATSDVVQLHNKKVFLVDDVYTTGSTMEECAKILKEAGAKQVWGISLSREE